jgi:hypothetical protein
MEKTDIQKRIEELKRVAKEARDARLKTVIMGEEGREFLNSLLIDDHEFLVGTGLGQELLEAVYAAEKAGTWSMNKETMQQ